MSIDQKKHLARLKQVKDAWEKSLKEQQKIVTVYVKHCRKLDDAHNQQVIKMKKQAQRDKAKSSKMLDVEKLKETKLQNSCNVIDRRYNQVKLGKA